MAEKPSSSVPVRREETGISRRGAEPFGVFQRLVNEMDRMFDDFGFGRRWTPSLWSEQGAGIWAPDVDVIQRNNELLIRADLPGLKRDEVSVEVTEQAVTIQGERRREHEEEREGVYRRERSHGTFYRTIPLPDGVMTDQAKASFRDGVLEITMPAPPASKGRRIDIEEGSRK